MSAATEQFDVGVVGGGPAGVAAAIAAAEAGARTLLVEGATELGGNVSQALVHTICGLFLPAELGDAVPANPGFATRFAAELMRCGAAGEPERAGRVWVLPTDPPKVASVARRLCDATAGLEVRLGCTAVGASLGAAAGDPQALQLRDGGGEQREVAISAAIDTSGDAAVAALGGADTQMAGPGELQLPSYIFRLGDVDRSGLSELRGFERMRITHSVATAARNGELPDDCGAVLLRPGSEDGQVYLTLNLPRPAGGDYAPLDPTAVGDLGAAARSAAESVVAFLRRTRPAFEKCRVDGWPARIGLRETRRVVTVTSLSGDEIREGRRHGDEVAVSAWPVELWQDHRRARFDYPSGPCSIPLGALVSRSHARLATAGRCMGGEREALGALRVIGTALATGEAAGVAAACAADRGMALTEVAAEDVRRHILERAEAPSARSNR